MPISEQHEVQRDKLIYTTEGAMHELYRKLAESQGNAECWRINCDAARQRAHELRRDRTVLLWIVTALAAAFAIFAACFWPH